MSKIAYVIGAGIAGPMAAITLARAGYNVTVFEQKDPREMTSDGILGITGHNWQRLTQLGARIGTSELNNTYWDRDTGKRTVSEFHYITWRDLHDELVVTAANYGVQFRFRTRYNPNRESSNSPSMADFIADPTPDLTVWASGVGTASQVTKSRYTGYVIYRGSVPFHIGQPWMTRHFETETGRAAIMVGDTREGASVTMFIPRDKVAEYRTNYTQTPPAETFNLDSEFYSITDQVETWQYTPMSDWKVPNHMVTLRDSHWNVHIGDANGQLRPATSMGANLAIDEAYQLLDIVNDGNTESKALLHRDQWKVMGEGLGI